ncbi:MAG TPA: hypothetical protein VMU99_02755 [Acidimicrobiales bacterium]|nr:hypothetical protein [Acidimicrobiales bacterium]
MSKALACGTPVIARRRRAASEIVDSGVVGLIGDTDAALVSVFSSIDAIIRKSFDRTWANVFLSKRRSKSTFGCIAASVQWQHFRRLLTVEPQCQEIGLSPPPRPINREFTDVSQIIL